MVSEAEIFDKLAQSAYNNRLVLFLGTGFSRSVLGYDKNEENHYSHKKGSVVPTWMELLAMSRKELGLTDVLYPCDGVSIDFPTEASNVVGEIAKKDGLNLRDAELKLKEIIGDLSDWYPAPEQVCEYQCLFEKIKPALILTTNYDDVIETILHKGYRSNDPSDVITRLPDQMIPIYHLHGARRNVENIVLTKEDYVRALRPQTYRQSKLACILRENTVVYLGYSKSDINVLAALDTAINSFGDVPRNEDIIQLQVIHGQESGLRQDAVALNQYVMWCSDTWGFFNSLATACENVAQKVRKSWDELKGQYDQVLALDKSTVKEVIKNKRAALEAFVKSWADDLQRKDNTVSIRTGLLICLAQELYNTARAATYIQNNFSAYRDCLRIVVMLLKNMEILGIRSFFFDFAASKFDELAPYIGGESGQSWSANNDLLQLWPNIPSAVKDKLLSSAQRHGRDATIKLINRISK